MNFSKFKFMLDLLTLLALLTGSISSAFEFFVEVPAKVELATLISTETNPKNVYFKEAQLELGNKVIQIGQLDPKLKSGFKAYSSIYTTLFSCDLRTQLSTQYLISKENLISNSQIVRLDEGSIETKLTESLPQIKKQLTYKTYLTVHFISEKNKCNSDPQSIKKCLQWDKEQSPPHFNYAIAEFSSQVSPTESGNKCFQYAKQFYSNLAIGAQKAEILSVQMEDLTDGFLGNISRAKEAQSPIGYFVRKISGDKQNPIIDFSVGCRVGRGTQITDSLGVVRFTFSPRNSEVVNGQAIVLGNIRRMSIEAGPNGSSVPYVSSDEIAASNGGDGVETRIFQYYSARYPSIASDVNGLGPKFPFPFAIDILVYNKASQTLNRSIFDFKRNQIWQEEFNNLEFNSLAELLSGDFWAQNQNNWFDLKNNKYIKSQNLRLEDCSF
jgi:hypothetical protein